MSHGWDTRTVIETAVSHRWARRIQREPPVLAAARNVLNCIVYLYLSYIYFRQVALLLCLSGKVHKLLCRQGS